MKKVICNEDTVKLAEEQMILSFKECYLRLQHCLLTFLERANGPEEKEKYKRWIGEVGETYKRVRG